MKKTLAAVAVLGAFAGSALAADVQLYGIVDTGVRYMHRDFDVSNAYGYNIGSKYDATDSFSMESGMASGSRWGLKGTEELGNGLTVGFVLEDGFTSDNGAEKGVMFDRESSLFLQGGFGKFAMGRIGSINGGGSSWAKHGVMSAFGTSWQGYSANADNIFGNAGQWDNMIAYETPDFAGFKVFAQYGMGSNDNENESSSDRYYAIGASYANGPLNLFLSVDSTNYKSWDGEKATDPDDAWTVRFGGNYDFEVVKIFAGFSYFDNAKLSNYSGVLTDRIKYQLNADDTRFGTDADVTAALSKVQMQGWSLGVSASVPVAGGQVLAGVGYLDAEASDSVAALYEGAWKDAEMSRWIVSVGYDYPFSKRTDVYAVATFNQDSVEFNNTMKDEDPSAYGVMIGLRHRF